MTRTVALYSWSQAVRRPSTSTSSNLLLEIYYLYHSTFWCGNIALLLAFQSADDAFLLPWLLLLFFLFLLLPPYPKKRNGKKISHQMWEQELELRKMAGWGRGKFGGIRNKTNTSTDVRRSTTLRREGLNGQSGMKLSCSPPK